MSAISVYLAARDESLGERIATALNRSGHTARMLTDEVGDLAFDDGANDDASIVIWSNTALRLARLHDQARAALERGALIPVAIGGAHAPSGFEDLSPVDLSGWGGDERDPRWRFVLDEINIATRRKRMAVQGEWARAQDELVQVAPPYTISDAAIIDAPRTPPRPPKELSALRRFARQRFDPLLVGVVCGAMLCVMTGTAIIFAPAGSGRVATDAVVSAPAPLLPMPSAQTPNTRTPNTQMPAVGTPAVGTTIENAANGIIVAPSLKTPRVLNTPAVSEPAAREIESPDAVPLMEGTASEPTDAIGFIGNLAMIGPAEPAIAEGRADDTHNNASATDSPEASGALLTEKAGATIIDCAACPTLKVVPAGSFLMGAAAREGDRPAERPVTEVTVNKAFAIGVGEVTLDQWNACIGAGACRALPYQSEQRQGYPAAFISYNAAQEYLAWLTKKTGHKYRLPSEAEWEYAARAGMRSAFFFGDALTPKNANYDATITYQGRTGEAVGAVTKTGAYPANGFGLYDMHGNLWEWTADCWNGSHRGASGTEAARMRGDCSQRAVKGGAFNSGGWRLRAGHRISKAKTAREDDLGLRVVRELD